MLTAVKFLLPMENQLPDIQLLPSRKGGSVLIVNNHVLHVNFTKQQRKYWKCREANCKVTAITDNGELVKLNGAHTHPPDKSAAVMRQRKHDASVLARQHPTMPMKRVYEQAFGDVNLEDEQEVAHLPSLKSLSSTLYRSRAKRLPNLPHTRADINLQGEWASTQDGREFILANDGNEDKMIIFGTVQNLRLLCEAETIFMDGTFKVTPEMFSQVYSIHVMKMGIMVPVCVALLPQKNHETYSRFFHLLLEVAVRYGFRFDPRIVCIDFESAVIATITEMFPNARIRGCLFHYSQAIWRKVQNLGLSGRYTVDDAFNRLVRRAAALPLVPREQVDEVWLEAMNEVIDEDATRFTDYMTTTWVDNLSARFPVEMWTHDDNIEGQRTNNHLEGWHSTLNKALSRPHPNIYQFIEMLKSEQRNFETQLRILQAGGAPPVQRAKARRVTDRLVRLRQRLTNNDITVHQYAGFVGAILKLHD